MNNEGENIFLLYIFCDDDVKDFEKWENNLLKTYSILVVCLYFLYRTKEAQEVYERALFYDSSNPDIYYNVSFLTDFI